MHAYDFGTFAKYQNSHPSKTFTFTISTGLMWIKVKIGDRQAYPKAVHHETQTALETVWPDLKHDSLKSVFFFSRTYM